MRPEIPESSAKHATIEELRRMYETYIGSMVDLIDTINDDAIDLAHDLIHSKPAFVDEEAVSQLVEDGNNANEVELDKLIDFIGCKVHTLASASRSTTIPGAVCCRRKRSRCCSDCSSRIRIQPPSSDTSGRIDATSRCARSTSGWDTAASRAHPRLRKSPRQGLSRSLGAS
jgi:hypothetical protein